MVTRRGASPEASLAFWLRRAGLTLDDVEIAELGFPDIPAALAQRSIDAGIAIEPFVTRAVDLGGGAVYQRTDELIPGYQIAEIIYAGHFAGEQADTARRFMIAYLRGVRYYNDAFSGGDLSKREEVVGILTRNTTVKDPALYERMVMPGLHPDGRVTLASLIEEQEFWLAAGLQQAKVNLEEIVDQRFADAAVQALGPYR
jgi:NitT/TauT family transport system substrate-binding protein